MDVPGFCPRREKDCIGVVGSRHSPPAVRTPASANPRAVSGSSPLSVSYTHLDVYKRQLLDDYHLKPSECVFTDDVKINAAAASDVGVLGVHFRNARVFARSLAAHGVTLNRKHPGKKPPEAPAPESAPSAEKQE